MDFTELETPHTASEFKWNIPIILDLPVYVGILSTIQGGKFKTMVTPAQFSSPTSFPVFQFVSAGSSLGYMLCPASVGTQLATGEKTRH